MKSWQILLLVVVAVLGVATVVYFATRTPPDEDDALAGDEGESDDADTVEGIGNGLTGIAATITRAM